jgi:large conductance mechanosensitive channel
VIEPGIKIGNFLGSVVDFLIIAFVLYLAIRALQRFKRKEEAQAAIEESKPDPVLVEERLANTLERLTQVLESQNR